MILIVCDDSEPAVIWARHLERLGHGVVLKHAQDSGVTFLSEHRPEAILLDLTLSDGSALAIADYANYRWPGVPVIFVTRSRFFSDGSIFQHISNTAAMVPLETPPSDLAEIVSYHGARH